MRNLPRNWKCLRLEGVCSFHRGLTYKKKDEVDFSQNAVLRANNVSLESGRLDLTEIRYIDNQTRIPPEKKVRKGSLLVCMASGSKKHLGKVALIDEDYGYAFGGFMGLLLPNAIVYPKYLYWITQSKDYSDYIMGLSDGANINNLKFSQLGKYQVPLPPLPAQKRIVAILDEAFAGIDTAVANTEKNLANARELFESYLDAVFGQRGDGWNHAKFSDLVSTVRPPRKVQRKEFLESGKFPIVSQEQGTINGRWSRQEDVIRIDRPVIIFGDHTRVFKYIDFDFVAGADGTKILRPAPFLHPKYLYYFAQSVPLEGLGYARHYRILKDTDVWYPEDVSEQEAISIQLDELVEDLNKLDAVYNRGLSALAELKQSLLQKAFSGELTAVPQDQIEDALA